MLSKRAWLEHTVETNITSMYIALSQYVNRNIFTPYESTPSLYVDELYKRILSTNWFWITIERRYKEYKMKCLPGFVPRAMLYGNVNSVECYNARTKGLCGSGYNSIIEGRIDLICKNINDIKFDSSYKIIWWGVIINGEFDTQTNIYIYGGIFVLHLPAFNDRQELTLAQIRSQITIPNNYGGMVVAVVDG